MKRIFETYGEFLDEALAKPNYISKARYSDGWAGTDAITYEQALKIAREGWKAGRAQVRAIADRLNVAGKVHRQQVIHDVVGDCWNMGRVISGEPECAMLFETIEETNEHGNFIKIIVNTATSGAIDESVMRKRGAAVLALIEALETAGKRLELWALFSSPGADGPDIRVCVKKHDELAEDDRIAFCLAHPSFSRRFGHAIVGHGIMPGNPSGIESECDIYLPALYLYDIDWMDDRAVDTWIREKLSNYGVTLDD